MESNVYSSPTQYQPYTITTNSWNQKVYGQREALRYKGGAWEDITSFVNKTKILNWQDENPFGGERMKLSNEQVFQAIKDLVLSLDLEGPSITNQIYGLLGISIRGPGMGGQARPESIWKYKKRPSRLEGVDMKGQMIKYQGIPEYFKGFFFSKNPISGQEGWFGYVGEDKFNSGYMRVYRSKRDEDWVFAEYYGLGKTWGLLKWPLKWDLDWFDINSLITSSGSAFLNWVGENPLEGKL